MPKRTDIKKILIIGSGPIVIGQACEFDYSGTQACKALRSEGYKVVLVNSNPATIMTDPELAERTYIEPLTVEYLEAIISHERPDALLPTVGGQTALNLAVALSEKGVLDEYGVELIGAQIKAIRIAEDRLLFKEAMKEIGLDTPKSGVAYSFNEALEIVETVGYPAIIRPSFTLGGTGGGIAFNSEEFEELAQRGLDLSPTHEILIEESVIGWKEFELEVMRDLKDNVVIICSIENVDPMGVHTGDSVTVAPIQTLTDKEYQIMRNAAIRVIRKVGVETGGSNIQFAVNPDNGRMTVIEMNPRVSRSSALASKATGFPIAKIAAKLAVGYTLNEIPNDITKKTPASFEPTIDYVVTKVPKWAFEKFPEAEPVLGTQMKSVGEVMAIGRTFKESFLKALRSLETGRRVGSEKIDPEKIRERLITPNPERINYLRGAFEAGLSVDEVFEYTKIDRWFLRQIEELAQMATSLRQEKIETISPDLLREAKRMGFSDLRLAVQLGTTAEAVRRRRKAEKIIPVYKRVDTCAAEFESFTPYLYSTYEQECEASPTTQKKIMILGSGPNRIGQGIEFDYCCCHASFALKEDGYETIMVNCNPETVSTDYDTSDRLYFEPLTFEDVMHIVEREKPDGVIVQFGGQTPLNLALSLQEAGVPIIGTSPESIDLAEDRKRFGKLLSDLQIPQPPSGTAVSYGEAAEIAQKIGFPVLVRPSYVLGGRAMVICYDLKTLESYMDEAVDVSQDRPILIDRFLEDAFEVDVDTLADGQDVVIGGIMEHIEEAGIHSGDSSCVLPTYLVKTEHLDTMRRYTRTLAKALNVVGLMNVQYAIKDDVVYVLEVNPRASRTVPFVSKATGVPLAKVAARLMTGRKLAGFELADELPVKNFFVKSPVFPFAKFPGVDTILGPEMKSTGEVMGVSDTFGQAYAKAQMSASVYLPRSGTAFISVNQHDKKNVIRIADRLQQLGFKLIATRGTAAVLKQSGIPVEAVYKVNEGRPHIVDMIKSGKVDLILNTPLGKSSFFDERAIRRAAMQHGVPCITTLSGGAAVASGIAALQQNKVDVLALQEYHEAVKNGGQ
ncbi:MAG: carbamoyl-phosphate synthase large subunit [Acidobacteria bacterium]|nr:carbamoyl-phosphate synthase large subunit [Acidobacteriota bacterium]MCI0723380.1 carbamoyl-phosphate synthase large subunit [Acidobacteriota bacterium]